MSKDPETLRELRTISRIILLANANLVEKELSKVATTDERKKMWVLIDGMRKQQDIADEAGVTQMAVSYFLKAALTARLIEYEKGKPPTRLLDYVPPLWIELFPAERAADQKSEDLTKQQPTLDTSTDRDNGGT